MSVKKSFGTENVVQKIKVKKILGKKNFGSNKILGTKILDKMIWL